MLLLLGLQLLRSTRHVLRTRSLVPTGPDILRLILLIISVVIAASYLIVLIIYQIGMAHLLAIGAIDLAGAARLRVLLVIKEPSSSKTCARVVVLRRR